MPVQLRVTERRVVSMEANKDYIVFASGAEKPRKQGQISSFMVQ